MATFHNILINLLKDMLADQRAFTSALYAVFLYLFLYSLFGSFVLFKYTMDKKPMVGLSKSDTVIRQNKTMSFKNYINHNEKTTILDGIPKVVYMLWDKGWKNAPKLQKVCLASFLRHNPDFAIRTMNLTEAEQLIDRERHYTDRAWHRASIQSKSDILRVEILSKYGGIWADASIYCNTPLSSWLNESVMLPSRFLCFERRDEDVTEELSPWISSWFLAAARDSDMVLTWRNNVRQAWNQTHFPISTVGYYWMHRLFQRLVATNSTFRAQFQSVPFMDAGPVHFCLELRGSVPHFYKLKTKRCKHMKNAVLSVEHVVHNLKLGHN